MVFECYCLKRRGILKNQLQPIVAKVCIIEHYCNDQFSQSILYWITLCFFALRSSIELPQGSKATISKSRSQSLSFYSQKFAILPAKTCNKVT